MTLSSEQGFIRHPLNLLRYAFFSYLNLLNSGKIWQWQASILILSILSADYWSLAVDQWAAAAKKFDKIWKGQRPHEVIQILPIITITSILPLVIQTATLVQSIYLLPSHWCLASQTTAQIQLKEVLSKTIWSICLRGSITIQLCRELKMEPERKFQMDLNKMVPLMTKNPLLIFIYCNHPRPSVLQLPWS